MAVGNGDPNLDKLILSTCKYLLLHLTSNGGTPLGWVTWVVVPQPLDIFACKHVIIYHMD